MCKYGKEQAGYRSHNPISHFHINCNFKNSNEELVFGEEKEQVSTQPKTEQTSKLSSDSTPIPRDMKVHDVAEFNEISTTL